MTENKQTHESESLPTGPEPEDTATGEELADTDSAADDSGPPRRGSRLPTLLAGAALAISLLAASAAAWLSIGERAPHELSNANRTRLSGLSGSVDELSASLQNREQRLSALGKREEELSESIEGMRRTLGERLHALESVPGRLSSLEASLAALQGISSGVRDTWLLAEAEHYMEIANAQLQLAANPELARIALELADERLAKIADPGLTDVRRALANELRAIRSLDVPDIEGTALILSSLAGTVDALPLQNAVLPADRKRAPVNEEPGGLERALASLKQVMSEVVSVRRTDKPVRPLLPPDEAYFLRGNLTLQLQAARLALLRGEQALFEQSLDDAANWLETYYDTERKPVSSALETIVELRQSQTTTSRVDISESLTLLRRYLSLKAEDRKTTYGQPQ